MRLKVEQTAIIGFTNTVVAETEYVSDGRAPPKLPRWDRANWKSGNKISHKEKERVSALWDAVVKRLWASRPVRAAIHKHALYLQAKEVVKHASEEQALARKNKAMRMAIDKWQVSMWRHVVKTVPSRR